MESLNLLRHFSSYNTWVNQKLYAVCALIPDAERKRDQGAFFGSIHRTLNHLLLTDRMWLGRFTGVDFPINTLGDELFDDFDLLSSERIITDANLSALFSRYTEADLATDLHYISSAGQPRCYPLHHVLLHVCNHQTHHRGQVTALIQRLGFNYGDIDMLFMPTAGRLL